MNIALLCMFIITFGGCHSLEIELYSRGNDQTRADIPNMSSLPDNNYLSRMFIDGVDHTNRDTDIGFHIVLLNKANQITGSHTFNTYEYIMHNKPEKLSATIQFWRNIPLDQFMMITTYDTVSVDQMPAILELLSILHNSWNVCTDITDIEFRESFLFIGRANASIHCEKATRYSTALYFKYTLTSPPTAQPSLRPSLHPSESPTKAPTTLPTQYPTKVPTTAPQSEFPTVSPTISHTSVPTQSPTEFPSTSPSKSHSIVPSRSPTSVPTVSPTVFSVIFLTWYPSAAPTVSITSTLYPMETKDTRYFWYTVVGTSFILLCYGAVCALCYLHQTQRMRQLLAARKAEEAMVKREVVEGSNDTVESTRGNGIESEKMSNTNSNSKGQVGGVIHRYQSRDMNQGTEEVCVGNTIEIQNNTFTSGSNTNCISVFNVSQHKCSVDTIESDLTSVTASTVHINVSNATHKKCTASLPSLPTIPSDDGEEEEPVTVVEYSLSECSLDSENVEPKPLDSVIKEPLSMVYCEDFKQEQIEYDGTMQNNRNIQCLKFAMDYLNKNENESPYYDRRDTVLTADHKEDGMRSRESSLSSDTQNTGLIRSVLGNIFGGMESIDDIDHQNASLSNISSE
eukprot:133624_1